MHCMLGVSEAEPKIRSRHLTSAQIRTMHACLYMFGMETLMRDFLSVRRSHWLGPFARMANDRIPKNILFG